MNLDETQRAFYNSIINKTHDLFILTGRGGTGKSITVGVTQAELESRGEMVRSLYPTHQAKKIGMKAFREAGGIETEESFITVHSFIGVKKSDADPEKGESVFSSVFLNSKTVDPEKIYCMRKEIGNRTLNLFVDEMSMVNEQQLKKILLILEQLNVKWTLTMVGDFAQIPPVNGKSCREFLYQMAEALPTLTLEFTKIYRSNLEEIHAVCNKVRDGGKVDMGDNCGRVKVTESSKEFYELYCDSLLEDSMCLSFTNKLTMVNTHLAAEALSGDSEPIQVGFKYFSASGLTKKFSTRAASIPYSEQNRIGMYNGDPCEILSVGIPVEIEVPWCVSFTMQVQPVIVRSLEDGEKYNVWASLFSAHGKNRFDSEVENFLGHARDLCLEAKKLYGYDPTVMSLEQGFEKCSSELKIAMSTKYMKDRKRKYFSQGDKPDKVAWRMTKLLWPTIYFNYLNKFLLLRSVNAMTCHSAQGVGRDHVFINTTDSKSKGKDLAQSLMYTGLSRARESVTVLI